MVAAMQYMYIAGKKEAVGILVVLLEVKDECVEHQ